MTDQSNPLKAALRGSLRIVEDENFDNESPLSEATADSINTLLNEINDALADGMPERITDDRLAQLVDYYRSKALTWATEEVEKASKPKRTRTSKIDALAVDIEL